MSKTISDTSFIAYLCIKDETMGLICLILVLENYTKGKLYPEKDHII